ncbi:hypothetical protein B1M_05071, partial [Burkholderia sp. TJI49]
MAEVTAVGHVAGRFAVLGVLAASAVLVVDAVPDVDGVFRYQRASIDAVRLPAAFVAARAAVSVAFFDAGDADVVAG